MSSAGKRVRASHHYACEQPTLPLNFFFFFSFLLRAVHRLVMIGFDLTSDRLRNEVRELFFFNLITERSKAKP